MLIRRFYGYPPSVPIVTSLTIGVILSACATTNNTAARVAMAPLTGVDVGDQTKADPTSEQLDPNDSKVTCKPSYTQVYQPPLKLGGSGRIILVSNGQKCEVKSVKQALASKKKKNLERFK